MLSTSSAVLLLPVAVVRARCLLPLAPPCAIGRLPAARGLIAIAVFCAVFAAALAFAAAAAECVTAVLAPEALPFESKLTKSSARLLGTRRAREPPFRRSPLPMRGPTRAASLSPHRRRQLSRCRSLSCPARVHAATHPHPP